MAELAGLFLIIICIGTCINLHLSSVDKNYVNSVKRAEKKGI